MADYAISNVPRRVVYAPSGVGPYAFTFEILAQTDIAVYKGSTLLTLTTDYAVTINANGTGSVTLVATAGTSNITIIGARAIQRSSDYTTGGDLFASTLNVDLDSQTIFSQQVAETAQRSLKAAITDSTALNMDLPAAQTRANKLLGFTAGGEPVASNTTVSQLDAAVQSFVSGTGNNAATVVYTPAGSGAVATTVQAKFRETISVKDFGAVGNGVADDTTAINNAVSAAAGKALFFPSGTYITTTGINYTATTPIKIYGDGNGSEIKFTGTTGAAIYITGTPGVTNASLIISDLRVTTAANTAQAGIWLYGIAVYSVHDVYVIGNFSYGVRFSAAQQGEYSGGAIQAINGMLIEDVGIVSSNACDLHGVSFFCNGTNITLNSATIQDCFIHANHLVGGNGIAILGGGNAPYTISGNHIENNDGAGTAYGIRIFDGWANIVNNNIYANPTLGIVLTDSTKTLIDGNLISGGINIAVASDTTLVTNNVISGTLTNSSTTSNFLNNRDSNGNAIDIASNISSNKLTVQSTNTTPGLIADFRGNASNAGFWGVNIQGAGAFAPYVSFNGGPGVGGFSTSVNLYTDITAAPIVSGLSTTYFAPGTDNITASGWSTNRWTVVYATTGTINTSDATQKQQIRALSDAEKQAAHAIKLAFKAFKFNDSVEAKGDKARIHIGVIAQEVKEIFAVVGLNADEYGLFCSDTLEDGSVRLGIRYEELLAFVISAI